MCVVCAQAKLPYRIAAFANQLRRLASCRTGQAACLFVRGAWDHICMAAECWHKFFRHFMTSNSKCFMRLRWMFHLDVACVSSRCCITCMLQVYISNVSVICFKKIFQLFLTYVAYVVMAIHVYCKCMFQMFQLFKTYVASVLSRCYIFCMGYTRMLQVYISNVSCFKRILQIFYLNVAVAIHICCKRMFVNVSCFFRTYVAANALCYKCCMTRRGKWA
jgi:hypothetical protein